MDVNVLEVRVKRVAVVQKAGEEIKISGFKFNGLVTGNNVSSATGNQVQSGIRADNIRILFLLQKS